MNGYRRVVECLVVRVAEYERDIMNALTIHVVDSIATTTTDTNHLDDAVLLLRCSEVQNLNIVIVHGTNYFLFYLFTLSLFHSSSIIVLPNFRRPFFNLFQVLFSLRMRSSSSFRRSSSS